MGRALRELFLLFAVASLLVPSAAGQSRPPVPVQAGSKALPTTLEIELGPDRVVVTWSLTYLGDGARQFRDALDLAGDGNGLVAASEADDWENVVAAGGPRIECDSGLPWLRWGTARAGPLLAATLTLTSAEGAIVQEDPIVVTLRRTFSLPTHPAGPIEVSMRGSDADWADLAPACFWPPSIRSGATTDEAPWAEAEIRLSGRDGLRVLGTSIRPSSAMNAVGDAWAIEPPSLADGVRFHVARPMEPSDQTGAVQAPHDVRDYGPLSAGLALLALAAMMWRGWLGGWFRVSRRDALESPVRARILEHVRDRPGLSVHDLEQELRVPRSTLVHHIGVLSRTRHVATLREGARTRVFPYPAPARPSAYLDPVDRSVWKALRAGEDPAGARTRLGLTPKAWLYRRRKVLRRLAGPNRD